MKATANAVRITEYWPAEAEVPTATPATAAHAAHGIGFAAVAPLIGLAYVLALPFAGIAALAWLALRALGRNHAGIVRAVKNVVLFLAAPFIGLAYAIAFPLVGAGALVWMAIRAVRKRRTAAA